MELKVTATEAQKILSQIDNKAFQRGRKAHWKVGQTVSEKSANWLYCWAATGMGSVRTANAVQRAFDRILKPGYGTCNITLEQAQRNRYDRTRKKNKLGIQGTKHAI